MTEIKAKKQDFVELQEEPEQNDIESQRSTSTADSNNNMNAKQQTNQQNFQIKEEYMDQVIENFPPDYIEQSEQNSAQDTQLLESNSLMSIARRNFMKKVFCIIFFQLLITSVMCGASMYINQFLTFQLDYQILLFIALGPIVFIQIFVCASRTAARRVPINYILLLIFTLSWAYLISFFCSGFSVNSDGTPNQRGQTIIFLSVLTTFAIVFALSFFACVTNIDFTIGGTSCSILGSALAIVSILFIFGFPFIYIAYSLVSGVSFGFYLVFDIQTIMDGKYSDITLDDYILASMVVYTDIVMLFIRIVEVVSRILPRD